jgi:hypothetical protein
MPLILTVVIILVTIVYVRSNRRAKQRWLTTLDLPGKWVMQDALGQLTLEGGLSGGTFVLRTEKDGLMQERSGDWRFAGQFLQLITQKSQRSLKVNFFRAGVLSLEQLDGTATLFHKAATNVVPIGGS